jgi:hypothetical protein
MPSVQSLAQDNRIFRNRLKAGLDARKYPIDGPLWPLVFLSVKLLRHDEALELLADRGFGTEAGMILRTMFEAAVNIAWISKDPIIRLKRYSDYQFVSTQKSRDYIEQYDVLKEAPPEIRAELQTNVDNLNQKAQEVKEEYGFNLFKHWSGKSLKDIATEMGWGERYEVIYRMYSDVIHSGFGSVNDYLVFDKSGKISVNYKDQTGHCKACLSEGQVYMLGAFGTLNILLDLKLDQVIEDGFTNKGGIIGKNLMA